MSTLCSPFDCLTPKTRSPVAAATSTSGARGPEADEQRANKPPTGAVIGEGAARAGGSGDEDARSPNLLVGRLPKDGVHPKDDAEFDFEDVSIENGLYTPRDVRAQQTVADIDVNVMIEATPPDAEGEARLTEAARWVSVVSLLASIIAASLGLGIGFAEDTLSLVGFGLEAFLDGVSSALVLWRFKRPKVRQHRDGEAAECFKAERAMRRERRSGVGIGATFVASSILLLLSAFYKLLTWSSQKASDANHIQLEHEGANYSVILSLPSALIFGVLALAKYYLARLLKSHVLEKDALCSVLGAVLALICGVAGLIEEATESPDNMAVVDVAASTIIAMILLVEGLRTLKHNASAAPLPGAGSGAKSPPLQIRQ